MRGSNTGDRRWNAGGHEALHAPPAKDARTDCQPTPLNKEKATPAGKRKQRIYQTGLESRATRCRWPHMMCTGPLRLQSELLETRKIRAPKAVVAEGVDSVKQR